MEESRSGSLRQAAAAAFPLTIPVFTGFLVLGHGIRCADADQWIWGILVHPDERCCLLRQYAVCGDHPAHQRL